MKYLLPMILIAGFVSGCVTNQGSSGSSFFSSSLDRHKSTCTEYGFAAGSSDHAQCVQSLSMAAQAKRDCLLNAYNTAVQPYTGYTATPTSTGQMLSAMGQAGSGC